jgi:hypothetical protein
MLLGQSAGFPHASVLAGSHVGWQLPLPEPGSKQQTPLTQGQVPASLLPLLEPPELLLLDPLLLPEVLPLPLLPDPLPLEPELVLPDPLAVPELLPPLPLLELDPFPPSSGMLVPLDPLQPVWAAPASTRTRTLGATRNRDLLGMRMGSGREVYGSGQRGASQLRQRRFTRALACAPAEKAGVSVRSPNRVSGPEASAQTLCFLGLRSLLVHHASAKASALER